eukprot:CAMPEP_0184478218 /NCGR_PEP_ID=MMETSP0113_2-20130426/301_1 /TAXON_ID=91329 /ORGANISM="Norrisiella sphaerica, Strain BC52" /LENGTH=229 /DNA_ID=CAMNT_0026855923 /DNA_START=9 /DNA_END=695 /DNA_ORIENTATION=+
MATSTEDTLLLDRKEVLTQCEKIFYFTLGTLALAGGIGSTVIGTMNLFSDFKNFPIHFYAIFFGVVITVLEANRFLSFPYMSSAVKFQLLIEEWIHLFATTWGRAALYLFEALLLVTYGGWLDWLGFAYMTVLAIFAMLLAMSAGKKLDSIKSVMKDMSRGVNMNDIAFVESKFDEWDTDKNGSISIHELRDVAIACGSPMSVAETEVAYNILDADRSGTITKREFLIW